MINKMKDNNLINGENLETLKKILPKIEKKVSIIYIDPPYNTGKKMGKYNDSWATKELYIDFLKERLDIAKKTLKPGGIIFVSIGERMQSRVKNLLEDIFKEKNHVASIIWKNKYTVSNDKIGITGQNEYIFAYTNDIRKININNDPLRKEYIKTAYKHKDEKTGELYRLGVQMWKSKNPETSRYDVVSPTGVVWNEKWNFKESSFKDLDDNGIVYWGENNDKCPTKKVYLKNTKGRGINNIWHGEDVGYTSDGTAQLKSILGISGEFLYPKPVQLIKRILEITYNKETKDDLVLDFFAGSGTTGQAVLEFNNENKTNLRFLLITNNEDNICESITLPRIESIYNGYKDSKNGIMVDSIGDKGKFNYIE